jgi:hypothetical protein
VSSKILPYLRNNSKGEQIPLARRSIERRLATKFDTNSLERWREIYYPVLVKTRAASFPMQLLERGDDGDQPIKTCSRIKFRLTCKQGIYLLAEQDWARDGDQVAPTEL